MSEIYRALLAVCSETLERPSRDHPVINPGDVCPVMLPNQSGMSDSKITVFAVRSAKPTRVYRGSRVGQGECQPVVACCPQPVDSPLIVTLTLSLLISRYIRCALAITPAYPCIITHNHAHNPTHIHTCIHMPHTTGAYPPVSLHSTQCHSKSDISCHVMTFLDNVHRSDPGVLNGRAGGVCESH